jgi:hypothetical protein
MHIYHFKRPESVAQFRPDEESGKLYCIVLYCIVYRAYLMSCTAMWPWNSLDKLTDFKDSLICCCNHRPSPWETYSFWYYVPLQDTETGTFSLSLSTCSLLMDNLDGISQSQQPLHPAPKQELFQLAANPISVHMRWALYWANLAPSLYQQ